MIKKISLSNRVKCRLNIQSEIKHQCLNFIFILFFSLMSTSAYNQTADLSRRSLIIKNWWERTAGLKIVTLKKNMHYGQELSLDSSNASKELDDIKNQGFQAIEIFAPADGLSAYNGLDTKNHYSIDSELGKMEDFCRLVRMAHERRIAVVAFINLGYLSIEAPDWIQACKDKKSGKLTDKVNWFLWSDKVDTPAPPTQEDIYNTAEEKEQAKEYWGWHWSELAGSYYWSRWRARTDDRKSIPLPQMNWGSKEWPDEAERIIRFWMETGLDGLIIDAPLCYPYMTWEQNRKLVSVIKEYGNVMIDPEGGRDPAWITEAGYNCLHEYGMAFTPDTYRWGEDVLDKIFENGNPKEIEIRLKNYHDAVFNSGGILYAKEIKNFEGDSSKRHLLHALFAGIGEIIVYTKRNGDPDEEETRILQMKSDHPALYPKARRRKLNTNNDNKYYSFLKTSLDSSERIVAVYNFQSSPQNVQVDITGLNTTGLMDIKNHEVIPVKSQFNFLGVDLPAYGYRFFKIIEGNKSINGN